MVKDRGIENVHFTDKLPGRRIMKTPSLSAAIATPSVAADELRNAHNLANELQRLSSSRDQAVKLRVSDKLQKLFESRSGRNSHIPQVITGYQERRIDLLHRSRA